MVSGSSAIMEDLVTRNSRLGCVKHKRNIFLSHSGAQKAFVRRLRIALESNAYLPFFDENPDCLRKGEAFAQHLKIASRLTDVGVVVVSDEYLRSKWPMIELAIFVEEQKRRRSVGECKELKILPLFLGLSVKEFREAMRQSSWVQEWKELSRRDNRIDISAWEEAVKVLGGHNGLEYYDYKTEEDYIGSIVSAIFYVVPPDLKLEDSHVKGKGRSHQAVAVMFAKSASKTRFHNVRAIGLYGMGGAGKTTLCKSLCDEYFVKFNGKVWHAELGKKSAEEIQKDVLRHLAGMSETLLNQMVKTNDQLQSLLQRSIEYKVFLAIDNVWNEDVSREQAEALLGIGFHPDSLVIVTSRSRGLLEWMGIHEECCFEIPGLEKGDAIEVLLQSAAPGCDFQSMAAYKRAAVDMLVERCFMRKGPTSSAGTEKQYVPLALKALGRLCRLPLLRRTRTELKEWVDNLDLKWPDQKEHPIFSVLGLSYANLPSSLHKSIFLDVALCVPTQQDNTSSSVIDVCKWLSMVYGMDVDAILRAVEDLERYGLVEWWQDMTFPLGMHELYRELAKVEVAKPVPIDEQVQYLYHEDERSLPRLMRMVPPCNCLPLNRVHIYGGGFTKLSYQELQYMVNVEVLKLDFCCEFESLDLECLERLRSVELRGCFLLEKVVGLETLQHLKFFRWNTCRNSVVLANFPKALEIVEIYGSKESKVRDMGSFEGCLGLLELTLSRHPLLTAVPDLSMLCKLEKVDFSGCCRVEEVRGLGGLRRLRHLNLENCKSVRHCEGLDKLVELESLNLGGCENIRVPEVWDLMELVKLRSININGNRLVQRLVLGSPQLEHLEVVGCRSLKTVALSTDSGSWKVLNRLNEHRIGEPVESRQWTVECRNVFDENSFDAYETLNLSNCHSVGSLGDIGSLTSLKYLYLQNCSVLKRLPNLGGSPHLQVVDLSYCCMLEDLGDIGALRALQNLYLQHCRSLRSLRNLSGACLKVMDLTGCSELEDLGNFDSLRSLQMLNLNGCVSLRTVPNLSDSPLFEVLNLKGCVKLCALPEMSTRSVVIDVSECWSLETFPFLDDLVKIELDVSIGDRDGELGENISQAVRRLKLRCDSYSGSEPLAHFSKSERTEGVLSFSVGEREIFDLFRTLEKEANIRFRAPHWKEAVRVLGGNCNWDFSFSYPSEDEDIDSVVAEIFSPRVVLKSKVLEAAAEMFARSPSKTRFHNVRAIGLYGTGGAGKTTLCKALCDEYSVELNGRVWHAELGKKSPEKIQKDFLLHLAGMSETLPNQTVTSNVQWQSLLRGGMEHEVFLAIDNVCNESMQHAEALLEMGFHPESLVIVTSREREVLERLGIHKEYCLKMPGFDKHDARAAVLHCLPPGVARSKRWDNFDKVMEIEGGFMHGHESKSHVPLALEVFGRHLSLALDKFSEMKPNRDFTPDSMNSNEYRAWIPFLTSFDVFKWRFDNLPGSMHKDIFIDVALFVPRLHDNTSATVKDVCMWLSMVYDEDVDSILRVLKDLERDGFVERFQDLASPFNIHDLYCEFAKLVPEGLSVVDKDFDDLKDIDFREDSVEYTSKSTFMRSLCICNSEVKELPGATLPARRGLWNVKVLKLDLCSELESLDLRWFKDLRSLELRGCLSLKAIEGLERLHHLKFIRWIPSQNLELAAAFSQASHAGFEQAFDNLEARLFAITPLLDLQGGYEAWRTADMPCLLNLEEVRRRGCNVFRDFSRVPRQFTLGATYGCKGLDIPHFVGPEIQETGSLRPVQCGDDVRHLTNMHRLLDPQEWLQRGYILHRYSSKFGIHSVTFSSICISSESMIELPSQKSFASVTKLEITKCKRLQSLSDVEYLPALESLVISQCSNLESLPGFSKSAALKHLTIRDFRRGLKFQFLSELCQAVPDPDKKAMKRPVYNFENLVELNLDSCVGLDGLEQWGPLPALESLLIKDCNTITQLPNLRMSSKLSSLTVLNCGKLDIIGPVQSNLGMSSKLSSVTVLNCGKLDIIGPVQAIRVVRIEGCGHEKCTYSSKVENLCQELKNVFSGYVVSEFGGYGVIDELTKWLSAAGAKWHCLDVFTGFDFSKFRFTGSTLDSFNSLMEQWASPYRGVDTEFSRSV